MGLVRPLGFGGLALLLLDRASLKISNQQVVPMGESDDCEERFRRRRGELPPRFPSNRGPAVATTSGSVTKRYRGSALDIHGQ